MGVIRKWNLVNWKAVFIISILKVFTYNQNKQEKRKNFCFNGSLKHKQASCKYDGSFPCFKISDRIKIQVPRPMDVPLTSFLLNSKAFIPRIQPSRNYEHLVPSRGFRALFLGVYGCLCVIDVMCRDQHFLQLEELLTDRIRFK